MYGPMAPGLLRMGTEGEPDQHEQGVAERVVADLGEVLIPPGGHVGRGGAGQVAEGVDGGEATVSLGGGLYGDHRASENPAVIREGLKPFAMR